MRPILQRTVAPTEPAVSLDEAKLHCRIDHAHQNLMIEDIIAAATEYVENVTNLALMPQTWRAYWPSFPSDQYLVLPRGPLRTATPIAHVKYTPSTGSQTTWASSNYILQSQTYPALILLPIAGVWPAGTLLPGLPVEVEFLAGYVDASAIPKSIKQAILLLTEAWYRNPSAVVTGNNASAESKPLVLGVDALLAAHKIYAF